MSYGTCASCNANDVWLDTLPGIDGKPVRVCESKECRVWCLCGEWLVTEQGEMCEWCRENTKEAA